jgi:2-hydroxycyclohexanecarboxyl-CoA dehydrogenase
LKRFAAVRSGIPDYLYLQLEHSAKGERVMRGLNGKTAIVTGGASGIGRAISQRLAEEGCMVGIFDINGDGAMAAASEIGNNAFGQACDITDYAAVDAAVTKFEGKAGPSDILVNCAGWDQLHNFLDSTPDFWDKVVRINLYGPLNMCHVVMKGMVERGNGGSIVNISSDAGRVGSSGESVYSACKGGMIAFGKTLAREYTRNKIRINTVCPGPTDTPLFAAVSLDPEVGDKIQQGLKRAIPMKRLGVPEDYAGMVAFLASDDAGYITGQTISVSGGLTMHG